MVSTTQRGLTRGLVNSNTSQALISDGPYLCRESVVESDSKWTFDVGTGHLGATVAQGFNIEANNAIAVAADFRFNTGGAFVASR